MKNSNLDRQKRKFQVVFDDFIAVFDLFGSMISLRQRPSDKLLGNLNGIKIKSRRISHLLFMHFWLPLARENYARPEIELSSHAIIFTY